MRTSRLEAVSNHHHMFHLVKQACGAVLWANLALLFCLSLFPFTTSWTDESRFAQSPVVIYGLNLLTAASAYFALHLSWLTILGSGLTRSCDLQVLGS